MLKLRPIISINTPAYQEESIEERGVFIISIVTEGSKEEQLYIKGCHSNIIKNRSPEINIEWINSHIVDKDREEKASHPLRRLELMKERLSRRNPYYKDYPDEAWLICDRDDGSFSAEQYNRLLAECQTDSIKLVVSNPAFQIWLLLHYNQWLSDRIFEDGLSSRQMLDIIEKRLKLCVEGYRHGSLNIQQFINRIENAKSNSRIYCTTVEKLKDNVGTNFAVLIDAIERHYN